MTLLTPTDHLAEIVWLGIVPDRGASLRATPLEEVEAAWEGFVGDSHSGLTRPACVRVKAQHPKGTEIRNTRQLSILSREELDATAEALGLDAIDPAWIGASLILRGIPDLTKLPPASRLIAENGTTITTDTENTPCNLSGREVERAREGHGKGYKAAAKGRRGLTAWIERPGGLALGDRLRLHLPPPDAWTHR
ncbi:MAG: sulfurase [Pseudomonadota bacterium]